MKMQNPLFKEQKPVGPRYHCRCTKRPLHLHNVHSNIHYDVYNIFSQQFFAPMFTAQCSQQNVFHDSLAAPRHAEKQNWPHRVPPLYVHAHTVGSPLTERLHGEGGRPLFDCPGNDACNDRGVHHIFFSRVSTVWELDPFTTGNPFFGGQNYLALVWGGVRGP